MIDKELYEPEHLIIERIRFMKTDIHKCSRILLFVSLVTLLFLGNIRTVHGASLQPEPLSGSWRIFLPIITVRASDPAQTCNKAQFIADVTFPNGTLVTQKTAFSKIWRLKNIGTCTWTDGYSLTLSSGESMGAVYPVIMPAIVTPGQEVYIWVNLIAPQKPGTYVGYWMLRSPEGKTFGIGTGAAQPLSVLVHVVRETTNWQEYTNNFHQISLMYPDQWRYISGDAQSGEYFAAEDGYFKVSALDGDGMTLDQVAQIEANQSSQPFGPNPTIEPVYIQGTGSREYYEARLVMASANQRDQYPSAELIVQFPTPRQINGKLFDFFVIYADVYNIKEIGFRLIFNASPIFYPAESATPKAEQCNAVPGEVVTIPITTYEPSITCIKVTSNQRVKIANQTGSVFRARLAWYNIALWADESVTLETSLGSFLAPGVHNLRIIGVQRFSPQIWLVNE